VTNLTQAELKLTAKLLDLASDVFANRNCNDFDLNFLSSEERREILKGYYDYTNFPEDYDESIEISNDFVLMEYLSNRIKTAIGQEELD
jgi:hypothetical protein